MLYQQKPKELKHRNLIPINHVEIINKNSNQHTLWFVIRTFSNVAQAILFISDENRLKYRVD